jgi:hypothetical protein
VRTFLDGNRDANAVELAANALNDLTSESPAPATGELDLALALITALMTPDLPSLSPLVTRRLQQVLHLPGKTLAELAEALQQQGSTIARRSPGLRIPTQYAIFDNSTKKLQYDQLFDDQQSTGRLESSTGQDTGREIRQLKQVLGQMQNVTLDPKPSFLRNVDRLNWTAAKLEHDPRNTGGGFEEFRQVLTALRRYEGIKSGGDQTQQREHLREIKRWCELQLANHPSENRNGAVHELLDEVNQALA